MRLARLAQLTRDTWILAGLFVATTAVSLYLLALGRATAIEAFGFVSGALCVWLTVKESVWNFPVSLANVTAFCLVFFRAGLLADAGLQVVYFVLSAIGWYLWLHGGEHRRALEVRRVPRWEGAMIAVAGVLLTLGLHGLLRSLGGSVTFWDALTTAASLCAQWQLNRKYVESWYYWIAVDVIYVPLYLYKQLYLTAILYGVFLVMATLGWREWRRTWERRQGAAPA